MRDDAGPDEPRPASLTTAIRDAVRRYLEEIVVFLVINVGWMLLIVLFAFAQAIVPLLLVLAPVLALPTAALMRLAVATARSRAPSWSMAVDELGRQAGRKLLLAAIQLLVLGLGVSNLVVGTGIGGVLGVASAVVAGYALIASCVYALALWPIVCDPEREGPVRDQLRLAMGVVVLRPFQLGVLALVTALAVGLSLQLIVPAIFLPSLVLIAVAAYVVPVADRLRPA